MLDRTFIRVRIWRSISAFQAANPGYDNAGGLFSPADIPMTTVGRRWKVLPTPSLGDMHICADFLTLEVIAHELCHALRRRLRAGRPSAHCFVEQTDGKRFFQGNAEEEICYDMGRWVAALHAWIVSLPDAVTPQG
jgi:hypothetical protein